MNTLIVLPTARTVQRLNDIFMSCPFGIEFSKMYLPLWSGEGKPSLRLSDVVYPVFFTDVKSAGSLEQGTPQLRGYIISDAVDSRVTALGASAGTPYKVNGDELHVVLKNGAVNNSMAVRYFLSSIRNTLASLEVEPFTFQCEMLVDSIDLG